MTNEELLSVAEIVEKLTDRFNAQAAVCRERCSEYDKLIASMKNDHEAKMVEHRAAFGARTEADRKIIAGLREESAKCQAELDDLYQREGIEKKRRMDVEDERDALRAEVAALQERLRSSIARGDFAQMEVAALKSQTPKHPVKVGEWVRRLVPSPACDVGTVAKVVHVDDDTSEIEYDVKRIDGQHGVWFAKNCEPCDPPEATAKLAPKVGDTVRLVTHPEQAQVAKHLRTALQWPWMPSWGLVGQTGKVVKPIVAVAEAVVVALDGSTIFARWPIACLEVVSEATHDTEAGKAAAESAAKTEPVAEEIKVGDLVEVVSNRGRNTWFADVGSFGTVTSVEEINESISVHLDDEPGKKNALAGYVSFCDVRKVTT